MKTLRDFEISLASCREELVAFKTLLDTRPTLSERGDILPFLEANQHLAAIIGVLNPKIHRFDRLATEFKLFGNYATDLLIGDSVTHQYCLVEFEDAAPNSVFSRRRGRSIPDWSGRFNHGFSQIIDWFAILEDQRRTSLLMSKFGVASIQFMGILVIGRRHFLDESQHERLRWRSEHVLINSRTVNCMTFDEPCETLALKLAISG